MDNSSSEGLFFFFWSSFTRAAVTRGTSVRKYTDNEVGDHYRCDVTVAYAYANNRKEERSAYDYSSFRLRVRALNYNPPKIAASSSAHRECDLSRPWATYTRKLTRLSPPSGEPDGWWEMCMYLGRVEAQYNEITLRDSSPNLAFRRLLPIFRFFWFPKIITKLHAGHVSVISKRGRFRRSLSEYYGWRRTGGAESSAGSKKPIIRPNRNTFYGINTYPVGSPSSALPTDRGSDVNVSLNGRFDGSRHVSRDLFPERVISLTLSRSLTRATVCLSIRTTKSKASRL